MNNNEKIVRDFIAAWSRLNASELADYFSDGGVYHNMPSQPVTGRTMVAGTSVDLPCFGYFELQDGKIKVWRDYFDLATYTNALTAALQGR